MKSITNAPGPQGSNPKTPGRKSAQIAHSPGPVRRRTIPQNLPLSIRRQGDYESTGTQSTLEKWIPASVRTSKGRNDKIHIRCHIATVICDNIDDARSFVFYCGAAPKDQRDQHQLFSKLFTTATKNGDGNKLEIRSSVMSCGEQVFQAPLFTGKLIFRRKTLEDKKVAVIVDADLHLNINRALNHQRSALKRCDEDSIWKATAQVAKGLCGNDNLASLKLANGEHDHARKVCFAMVLSAIYSDVKRAANTADETGVGYYVSGEPDNFSLQNVETCWDIGGKGFDAVKALEEMAPTILGHGGKRGWVGNAGTVSIEFSKWERLVVYAKAPDRLRFEIRHHPPKGNNRYSSTTIPETLGKLDMFRELATSKVNALLSHLKSHQATSRTESEWEAYAMAWGASCGNSAASKEIYQILRQHGRILGGKYVECIQGGDKLLRKARDADLIKNWNGAFRPIFPNTHVLNLTHLDISGELLAHNTGTHPVVTAPNFPDSIRKRSGRVTIPPCPPFRVDRE